MTSRRSSARILRTIVFAVLAVHTPVFAGQGNEQWVGTWATALHGPSPGFGITNPGFGNQTLRQIVHTSVGGHQVRVRLSTFGASALVVGAAQIALHDTGAAIVPGSDRVLTFSGHPSITIRAGGVVLSDPVDLEVPALGDLAVSLFVPASATGPANWHVEAQQTAITPFEGITLIPGAFTPENEATRQAVNAWIRTGGEYDGVFDFDAAVRDPSHPTRLLRNVTKRGES